MVKLRVSDKIKSISLKLNPSTKLDFFYRYLDNLGVFASQKGELLNGSQKQELLEMILLYFKLHLQGFKSPKSLDVLNQVFN